MEEKIKHTQVNTWSRRNGSFCFGLKKCDTEYIASETAQIGQTEVIVTKTDMLITKCNINDTFTTTCRHLGNADIAKFIDENGKGTYAATIITEKERVVVQITEKLK